MKGRLQHEETIIESLKTGKTFLVPCESEKDANSKRVSLYNAKKRLDRASQAFVKIEKVEKLGTWYVRISRVKPVIYEEAEDGSLIEANIIPEASDKPPALLEDEIENAYTEDPVKRIIRLMLMDGHSTEDIQETLGESDKVINLIAEVKNKLHPEKEDILELMKGE